MGKTSKFAGGMQQDIEECVEKRRDEEEMHMHMNPSKTFYTVHNRCANVF